MNMPFPEDSAAAIIFYPPLLLLFSRACGITVGNKVIVIGGQDSLNSVRVYNESGLVENLPDINTGRYASACSYYLDNEGQMVNH